MQTAQSADVRNIDNDTSRLRCRACWITTRISKSPISSSAASGGAGAAGQGRVEGGCRNRVRQRMVVSDGAHESWLPAPDTYPACCSVEPSKGRACRHTRWHGELNTEPPRVHATPQHLHDRHRPRPKRPVQLQLLRPCVGLVAEEGRRQGEVSATKPVGGHGRVGWGVGLEVER